MWIHAQEITDGIAVLGLEDDSMTGFITGTLLGSK